MDLWRLSIFIKVIESGSFSKAADQVLLTQPTVSSHINDLEAHYGCRLIDRLGKEVAPTKAGQLLYKYARKLMALQNETEAVMADYHGKMRGHLNIGGSTIPGEYILPAVIGRYTADYPEVKVSLSIGDTRQVTEEVLSGGLELGIVGARMKNKKLVQEEVATDKLRLVVPADHKWADRKRVSLKNLLTESVIVREKGSGTLKALLDSLSAAGYKSGDLDIIAEMGSTTAVIQGIKNKVGISVLSTLAVHEELQAGRLKALPISGLNLQRSFYLTVNKHRTLSPLCKAFIKYLKAS
ncbi:MAG: LysR family transcriptional regulator [Desulfobacterales bacterium]|nr:LysR family transcriptional regulator [Desulfobacterales bacterium]